MFCKGMGVEFDFARSRGKTTWLAGLVSLGILPVSHGLGNRDSSRRGLQLLELDTRRRQFMGVSRLNVSIPKALAETEAFGQLKGDPGV